MAERKAYLAIDLKSFYASVECIERGLDPMTTNLVVADGSRTNKTVCLAVTPAMKALGVRNRCRVFEIPDGIEYIMAPPRMRFYIERSADVYSVYLRFFSPDDIFVYSIDEVFIDVTGYLSLYGCSARELGERVRAEVTKETGIPATCGLGTNLYLAKVALDIMAKHDEHFFGELDEESYKMHLWNHKPITDFWRVGPGYAARLAKLGIDTMGGVALTSEDILYKTFGVDAEILIDHAWGVEPVEIQDIKNYESKGKSLSNSQIIGCNRDYKGGLIIAKEMADDMSLKLVEQHLKAQSVHLFIGYDATKEEKAEIQNLGTPGAWRELPSSGGTQRLLTPSSSRRDIIDAVVEVYERIVHRDRMIHRIGLDVAICPDDVSGLQLDLFADAAKLERERKRQKAISEVKAKFGKNALLKGIDYLPEATARERNATLGGHRSGEEI